MFASLWTCSKSSPLVKHMKMQYRYLFLGSAIKALFIVLPSSRAWRVLPGRQRGIGVVDSRLLSRVLAWPTHNGSVISRKACLWQCPPRVWHNKGGVSRAALRGRDPDAHSFTALPGAGAQ